MIISLFLKCQSTLRDEIFKDHHKEHCRQNMLKNQVMVTYAQISTSNFYCRLKGSYQIWNLY